MIATYLLANALLAALGGFFALGLGQAARRGTLRPQVWLRLGQWAIGGALVAAVAANVLPARWSPRVPYVGGSLVRVAAVYEDPDRPVEQASVRPRAAAAPIPASRRHPATWVALFWLAGVLLGLARLAKHALALRALLARSLPIRGCRRVSVRISEDTRIPFSVLFPRHAYVVLPMLVLSNRRDLYSALHHEIQHHRNGDTRWILAMELLKVWFFWNPAIYFWARQMAQLQELACDEAVVTRKPVDSRDYGYCLLRVAQSTTAGRTVYLGTAGMSTSRLVGRSFLMRRIEMLTTYGRNDSRRGTAAKAGVALGLLLSVAAYAGAGLITKAHPLPPVDAAIQKIADAALLRGLRVSKARAAFALVTDAQSGKLLAVSFVDGKKHDAAEREKILSDYLTQPMYPWSTLKPLVAAMAIDTGKTRVDEEHDCGNGVYNTAGKMFTDYMPFSKLTTSDTIVKSSNICAIKIGEQLGAEGIAAGLQRFGMTPPSAADMKNPLFVPLSSFGIGTQFTTAEMARAYGAIANGGLLQPGGQRAISADTAAKMREILARVVTEGTGTNAQLADYSTAGKTGTGHWDRIVDDRVHDLNQEVAVFLGFAPARDPKVVISVHVEKPTIGDTQGGRHAAPIFAEIAEAALKSLGVAPDRSRR